MIIFFCIFFLGIFPRAYGFFEQYRAHKAYESGDIACAKKIYDELLTEQSDNAQVAYNLGKIALGEKEFQKAEAYFNHVTNIPDVPLSLQEQAWYDKGLSYVHRQMWQEALTSFQEVLNINPGNEYAKKMIEQIQKKLEEEKKQKEKQEEQKENNEQPQSDRSDEKKDNEQTNSPQNDQDDSQPDKDEQNNNEQNKNDQKSDEQTQNSDNDPQKNADKQTSDAQNQNNEGDKNERASDQNTQNTKQEQNNKEKEHQGSPQSEHGEQQASNDQSHKNVSSMAQQPGEQKELPDAKKAGTYGNQKPPDKELQLLELVEQHDAKSSKALFKRQIQQRMPGHYGQKNW